MMMSFQLNGAFFIESVNDTANHNPFSLNYWAEDGETFEIEEESDIISLDYELTSKELHFNKIKPNNEKIDTF